MLYSVKKEAAPHLLGYQRPIRWQPYKAATSVLIYTTS